VTKTVSIQVLPTCQLSSITVSKTLEDITTPLQTWEDRDMQEYFFTHQHETIWPTGSCIVKSRIEGGETTWAHFWDPTQMLTISSAYPSDVGTHSLTMTAFYSSWAEPTPPIMTASQTIQVEIEELCVLVSYERDQAVTYAAQHEHVLFDGTPAPFEFAFVYEPANCNVDQYYKILIDNQEADPPWL